MRTHLLNLSLLLIVTSCIGPQALQYKLNSYQANLSYTFDSPVDSIRGNSKIFLKVIDQLQLNDSIKVSNNGSLVVPLGIGGGYKFDFTVTLGKKSTTPSFTEFITSSFKTETARTGDFYLHDKPRRSDYILELKLTNCQISSQYHKDRIRFGHSNKENWILKPVNGTFTIEVRLLKKKKTLFSKTYTSTQTAQAQSQVFKSEYEMNKKMMDDFAKTASLEIKELVEASISDINGQLKL